MTTNGEAFIKAFGGNMANFDIAWQTSDKKEGGYALVTGDDGGETYNGIARVYNPKWEGWAILDRMPGSVKIHNARFPELAPLVRKFFLVNYWDKVMGTQIKDQRIAEVIFDFAITSGVGDAVMAAQRLVGSKVDGVMGPVTVGLINNSDGYKFLVDYCIARVLHYAEEAKRDPGDRKFLSGWWKRVAYFVRYGST